MPAPQSSIPRRIETTCCTPRRRILNAHPTLIVGGGITPKTGLRLGVGVATGDYVAASEVTKPPFEARSLNMFSFEGEYAFGYTKLAGEVTTDSLGTATGHERATQWFIQGIQSLGARWFVSGRHEGADAPPPGRHRHEDDAADRRSLHRLSPRRGLHDSRQLRDPQDLLHPDRQPASRRVPRLGATVVVSWGLGTGDSGLGFRLSALGFRWL